MCSAIPFGLICALQFSVQRIPSVLVLVCGLFQTYVSVVCDVCQFYNCISVSDAFVPWPFEFSPDQLSGQIWIEPEGRFGSLFCDVPL